MISLLVSLLGFGSSFVGPVPETRNKHSYQNKKFAMLHTLAEAQSKIQDHNLVATVIEANIAKIVATYKEQAATVRKGF